MRKASSLSPSFLATSVCSNTKECLSVLPADNQASHRGGKLCISNTLFAFRLNAGLRLCDTLMKGTPTFLTRVRCQTPPRELGLLFLRETNSVFHCMLTNDAIHNRLDLPPSLSGPIPPGAVNPSVQSSFGGKRGLKLLERQNHLQVQPISEL
ncbi:hypothetical protein HOY80DRAFT_966356 [Tuber brumale]|nr:hypothetical protein HOY80DRAFT_966356 [Tuber brumale]